MTDQPIIADGTPNGSMRRWAGLWVLVCVVLVGMFVRVPLMDQPFGRNGEGTGSWYGVMARNYLRHGLLAGGMAPMVSVGVSAGDAPTVYAHHPPVVPLMIAGVYAVAGDGEWQTRLFPAVCTVAAGVVVARLARSAGLLTSLIAGLSFATSVMSVRFGGMPDVVGSPLVLCACIAVGLYVRWTVTPTRALATACCAVLVGGLLVDWPMALLAAVLSGHAALFHKSPGRRFALILMAVTCFTVAVIILQLAAAAGGLHWLMKAAARRTLSGSTDAGKSFGLVGWLSGAWTFNKALHGTLLLGPVFWLLTRKVLRKTPADVAAGLLLAWAAVHIVIGRQGCLNHDWWWWPVTPGLALTWALGGTRVISLSWLRFSGRWWRKAIAASWAGVLIGLWSVSALGEISHCRDPHWLSGGYDTYLLHDLGRAIQTAAPPNQCVLVAEWDDEPQLWYYADRPIKVAVWDATSLARRSSDGVADLVYNFSQKWSPAPVALVMPAAYRQKLVDLHETLMQQSPDHTAPQATPDGKFLIYRLAAPPPPLPKG